MKRGFISALFALCTVVFAVNSQAGSFRSSSYAGRYSCKACSGSCFFTSTYNVVPDGAGFYFSGSQIIYGADAAFPSAGCSYTLDFTSVYSINSDGTGSESLIWDPSSSNSASCPGGYTDQTSISLSGSYSHTQVSDNNLGNQSQPGTGDCGK